jgi:hypothetical protein
VGGAGGAGSERSTGQQGVADRVEADRHGVHGDLRPSRRHVDPERCEDVVAEEPTGVAGLAGPCPQRQLEVGEGAVGTREVDPEHRDGQRRVDEHESRPAQRHQRTSQHHQHDDAVDDRHGPREQQHVAQPGTNGPLQGSAARRRRGGGGDPSR